MLLFNDTATTEIYTDLHTLSLHAALPISYVSADQQVDELTGQPYFVGRVKILPESLESVKDVSLYPGMPAEVLIVTGERRAIDYLISPITDSMNRAFRED